MKSPSLSGGLAFAFCAAIATAILTLSLPIILPVLAPKFTLALITIGYLFYLIKQSGEKTGRIVTGGIAIGVSILTLTISMSLIEFILIQLGLIWIVRSLYLRARPIPALIDGLLIVAGILLASWGILQTQSLAIAVWCFYLTQALFIDWPNRFFKEDADINSDSVNQQRFDQAWLAAQQAVEKLSKH